MLARTFRNGSKLITKTITQSKSQVNSTVSDLALPPLLLTVTKEISPVSSRSVLSVVSRGLAEEKSSSCTALMVVPGIETWMRDIHTLNIPTHTEESERKYLELAQSLPSPGSSEFYIRRAWITHMATHKLTIGADVVAQIGHAARLIDVRLESELSGPVGYIPGVNWFPRTDVDKIMQSFRKDELIAVICTNDTDSRDVVRTLRANGYLYAAIMAGGMRTWRLMGFSTSRDPAILQRKFVAMPKPETSPHQRNVFGGRHISLPQVVSHIGTGETIQWIKMAAFMVHGRMSCVDGRDDCGVIGTPGGDMGEFIMGLTVAETLMQRQLSEAEVSVLFQRRLDAFGRFYMHTDQSCLDGLMDAIFEDPFLASRLTKPTNDFAKTALLRKVPADCRAKVMELLLQPKHIGCGHLRLMITEPETYRIREDLVRMAMKNYFYAGWEGATECDYVVLSGRHEECGVANVTFTHDVHSFTLIPLIPPTIMGNQVFVNHELVASYLRTQQAEWFTSQTDILPLNQPAVTAFAPMMHLLADVHVKRTVGKLAANLPVYTLRFDNTGTCNVEYNGIVGQERSPTAETTIQGGEDMSAYYSSNFAHTNRLRAPASPLHPSHPDVAIEAVPVHVGGPATWSQGRPHHHNPTHPYHHHHHHHNHIQNHSHLIPNTNSSSSSPLSSPKSSCSPHHHHGHPCHGNHSHVLAESPQTRKYSTTHPTYPLIHTLIDESLPRDFKTN